MLRKSEFWKLIEPTIKEAGVAIFDIDMPGGKAGAIRIYIYKKSHKESGINHEDCEAVSKRLEEMPEVEELLNLYSLEVSSPGINRRLQLKEHFDGAIGEQVQVSLYDVDGSPVTMTGTLAAFSGDEIELEVEGKEEHLCFPLANVKKARVDFVFD